jgi:hypothetical protein
MNQRKPKRSKPPGGKAGVAAEIEEHWYLPAPKTRRVMDALVKVWKDKLLRGEEVPMPGGVAKVIWRKPTQWFRVLDGGTVLRGKKKEQLGCRIVRAKSPPTNISFRANVQFVEQEDGQFDKRYVELDRSHRRGWKPGAPKPAMSKEPTQQKRKGPKPPPEPEPLMLPRDAKTLAENRETYYRRLERERDSGVTVPTDRYQVPSRTDMFRRGRR